MDGTRELVLKRLLDVVRFSTGEDGDLGVRDSDANLGGVLRSLQSLKIISFEEKTENVWRLTEEGDSMADSGSYEANIVSLLKCRKTQQDIIEVLGKPAFDIGVRMALMNKWISIENGALVCRVDSVFDAVQKQLLDIKKNAKYPDLKDLEKLKRRKLVQLQRRLDYVVSRGENFGLSMKELQQEAELLSTHLLDSRWKSIVFKDYNFKCMGLNHVGGNLHPLMKAGSEIKRIFLEMGFIEMETNAFVESSFWNFDALFQPQHHPTRCTSDTFFIENVSTDHTIPSDYMQKVKSMHVDGGYGSIGYRCLWSDSETKKSIMRTHTTAVSAKMLYQLAQEPKFRPAKYFSVDRVYRNESEDATHLCEFHQVEGFIADRDLTLGDLIGVLSIFFKKLGMERLRFKPAYNPYTEPSLEVFGYHEDMKRWIEIGNSGIFRPEMLRPMGFDEDVAVIAWGLSLERPAMIKDGIRSIRDILGTNMNIKRVYNNPICMFGWKR